MADRYAEIAFTDTVKVLQEEMGSRGAYAKRAQRDLANDRLGPREAAFLAERDSFYMATVSETGWPYVQHRGGPKGFLRVLGDKTIGFADFTGNRQYVSVGNLKRDDRVSLILVDYPNRTRLKLYGHARTIGPENSETLARLRLEGYTARVERGILIEVAAFDWNCPQHITPRFTLDEVEQAVAPLHARIAQLEQKLATAGGKVAS